MKMIKPRFLSKVKNNTYEEIVNSVLFDYESGYPYNQTDKQIRTLLESDKISNEARATLENDLKQIKNNVKEEIQDASERMFGTERLHKRMMEYGWELENLLRKLLRPIDVIKKMNIYCENVSICAANADLNYYNVKKYSHTAIEFNVYSNIPYFRMIIAHDFKWNKDEMMKTMKTLSNWMDMNRWNKKDAQFMLYHGDTERTIITSAWGYDSDLIEIQVPVSFEAIGLEKDSFSDYLPKKMLR